MPKNVLSKLNVNDEQGYQKSRPRSLINGNVYSRVDTLKSDSNLNTLPFTRKSTDTDFLSSFT